MELYTSISIVLAFATVLSVVARAFKQPFIVAYLLSGIVIGPAVLNVFNPSESYEFFAKIGVTTLLFLVGLHLSPQNLKEVGRVAVIGGFLQVLVTSLLGFLLAKLLGFGTMEGIFVGVALTFSSTIVVLKVLSDKGDLSKLYGRVAVGFLLVQDIIASVMLLVLPNMTGSGNILTNLLFLVVKAVLLLVVCLFLAKMVLPQVTEFFAGSQELLFLFAITWGLGFAAVFGKMGFSVEIGALMAGVTLSTSVFSYEISSRLKPIRDFFVVLFFIYIGSLVVIPTSPHDLLLVILLALFVSLGNPIIVTSILLFLGFRKKTSFLTALTFGQVSEFSLVLLTLSMSLGLIGQSVVSTVTAVMLITVSISSYLMTNSDRLYERFSGILKKFESKKRINEPKEDKALEYEVLLCGFDRVGKQFVEVFRKLHKSVLAVDFNPASIARLERLNIPNRFGDCEDIEFLESLPLEKVKVVVSTIPDLEVNLLLLRHIKKIHPKTLVIAISHDIPGAKALYEAGCGYVIMPHFLGAEKAVSLLEKHGLTHTDFKIPRETHVKSLLDPATS